MQTTYATDVRISTARVAAPMRETAIAATKAPLSEKASVMDNMHAHLSFQRPARVNERT
jgi:hypothetical protein